MHRFRDRNKDKNLIVGVGSALIDILAYEDEAFLSKTGLCGALFFWYILFMILRAVSGGSLSSLDLVFLLLPLALLFFKEPLFHIITGERPILKEGFFTFLMEGFIEILESVSYYISNSVSFVRVAAFALSHVVLSFIVFAVSYE